MSIVYEYLYIYIYLTPKIVVLLNLIRLITNQCYRQHVYFLKTVLSFSEYKYYVGIKYL